MQSQKRSPLFVKSLCLYFLLLPLGTVNIGSVGSLLKVVGILPVIVFIFERCPKIRVFSSLRGEFAFSLMAAISYLWSISRDSSWERIYSQLLFLLLLLPIGAYTYTEEDIESMKKSLLWASRIVAVLTLTLGITAEGRLLLSGTFTEDPNLLSAYFGYGLAHCYIILLQRETRTNKKILAIVEILLYFYVIILTGSRGGLLGVIAEFGILFLFYREEDDRSILLKKAAFVVLFFVGMIVVLNAIPDSLLARYTLEDVLESRGTHRLDIWGRAFNIFRDTTTFRRWFGFGYNTTRAMFVSHGYPTKVMHNVFIEYLMEIGIVGLIIYINSLYCFIKQSWKVRDFYSISIIFHMIVLSMSTNIIAFKPYWNILILSMCIFICEQEKQDHGTRNGYEPSYD